MVKFAIIIIVALVVDVTLTDSEPVKLSTRATIQNANLTTQCAALFTPLISTSVLYSTWKVVNTTATIDCASLKFSQTLVRDGSSYVTETKVKILFQTSQGNIAKDFIMLMLIPQRGKYVWNSLPANFNYFSSSALSTAFASPAAFEIATLAGEGDGYCLYLCAADPQYNDLTGLYVMSKDGKPNAISDYCMNNLFSDVPQEGLHAVPSTSCTA